MSSVLKKYKMGICYGSVHRRERIKNRKLLGVTASRGNAHEGVGELKLLQNVGWPCGPEYTPDTPLCVSL